MSLSRSASPVVPIPEVQSSYAFAVQYTTLIIIILSFIVGTFSAHHIKEQKASEPAAVQMQVQDAEAAAPARRAAAEPESTKPEKDIGGPVYGDLFTGSSVSPDSVKANALAEVLLNHDLTARVEISIGEGPDAMQIALDRTETLFRFLQSSEVPPDAFRIVAVPGAGKEVRVVFLRQAEND